jgi:hypothetical protein
MARLGASTPGHTNAVENRAMRPLLGPCLPSWPPGWLTRERATRRVWRFDWRNAFMRVGSHHRETTAPLLAHCDGRRARRGNDHRPHMGRHQRRCRFHCRGDEPRRRRRNRVSLDRSCRRDSASAASDLGCERERLAQLPWFGGAQAFSGGEATDEQDRECGDRRCGLLHPVRFSDGGFASRTERRARPPHTSRSAPRYLMSCGWRR